MHVALWLSALVVTILVVSTVSSRLSLPAPVVLVVVGIAASYIPFVPEVRLTPEIVLVGLLPPLLYSAALQSSLIDFNTYRRTILSLSIGLVAFTTVGIAVIVHAVLPDMTWAAAFALGAVVAPPDAVAATAIARRTGLPRKIVTILEGESLLNDATALVALRTAVLATTGAVTLRSIGADFLRASIGGALCGVLVYVVVARVRRHVTEPLTDVSVSMVTPFFAYVLAEEIHSSGVLAVVVAGLLLGHKAPVIQTATSRIAERLNWRTVSFLLENTVFLLIGLQTNRILTDVGNSDVPLSTTVWFCVAVLAGVIVLRLVWVFPARYLIGGPGGSRLHLPMMMRYTAVVGWAGMRGVVTLAAAFAIPSSAPHRAVLVLAALCVTGGTLVIQGLSLPWVVRRLHLRTPDAREDALARADVLSAASQAGLARLDEIEAEDDEQDVQVRDLLRARVEQREFAAWERLGSDNPTGETPSERYSRLRLDMLDAERNRVLEIRSMGQVPHDIIGDVLAALDLEESIVDFRQDRRAALVDGDRTVVARAPEGCDHLRSAPDQPEVVDRRCADCIREGTTWVHLRQCQQCGHVGCCDSSPRRHASGHYEATGHPVMRSAEPGEAWRWCFVDETLG